MPINNAQSAPKWLQELNQGIDKLNSNINKVQQAADTINQATSKDRFVASSTSLPNIPTTPTSAVRVTMDNQGNFHSSALGLIDVSIDPDSLLNGEYTSQVKIESQSDNTKKLKTDFKVLGLFNYPIESTMKNNAKSLENMQIDFRGNKTLDVQANLNILGIKIPLRTVLQAERTGNGQYRFTPSNTVCKDLNVPNFVANLCLWIASKTSDFGGVSLSGFSSLNLNIPECLASQGLYGS